MNHCKCFNNNKTSMWIWWVKTDSICSDATVGLDICFFLQKKENMLSLFELWFEHFCWQTPGSLRFTGHVPTTKFLYGDTFGKATVKYFQDVRCASMACHASEYRKGGMFPCIYTKSGALNKMHCSQNRYPAFHPTYWARYNVDFKRQAKLKLFNEVRKGTVV